VENLKIRVNSEVESKEAQELFFELGYEKGACSTGGYPALIIATPESRFQKTPFSSRATSLNHEAHSQYKEITLPELRDLVVLKRNDVGDANVSEENCLYDLYLTESGDLYFYHCGKNKWILSNLNGDDDYYELLKPIEKPMKEYLIKSGDGKYLLTHHDSIGAIEIPEGAIKATFCNGFLIFWKDNYSWNIDGFNSKKWRENDGFDKYMENYKNTVKILWQRAQHPEELPFIDDEPMQSLNDQYAEIEKVRQSHRTASETSNPTIKETLNQRQSQYGSFEDVAMITEQMVDIMRKGYYENLAYNQKMALYMICSKMARIVNGDPNHKDSWHDIAGYATLIDNELESEKDMPF